MTLAVSFLAVVAWLFTRFARTLDGSWRSIFILSEALGAELNRNTDLVNMASYYLQYWNLSSECVHSALDILMLISQLLMLLPVHVVEPMLISSASEAVADYFDDITVMQVGGVLYGLNGSNGSYVLIIKGLKR